MYTAGVPAPLSKLGGMPLSVLCVLHAFLCALGALSFASLEDFLPEVEVGGKEFNV